MLTYYNFQSGDPTCINRFSVLLLAIMSQDPATTSQQFSSQLPFINRVTVGIVWRNDPTDKAYERGKGAFWDHYTLQTMLKVQTYLIPWNQEEEFIQGCRDGFSTYIKGLQNVPLPENINENSTTKELKKELKGRGMKESGTKAELWARLKSGMARLPHTAEGNCPAFKSPDGVDVIVIPGVSRGNDEKSRKDFEQSLLEKYAFKKRFILLCGGTWRLEKLGAIVGPSMDHSYSRMISLNKSGNVAYNIPIHNVQIEDNITSRRIWPNGLPPAFPVNSVHCDAVQSLGDLENKLEIVARCTSPLGLLNTNGKIMEPVKCIEAIVSKNEDDYPLVAIQWHTEAYCYEGHTPHKKLLQFALYARVFKPAENAGIFKRQSDTTVSSDDSDMGLCFLFNEMKLGKDNRYVTE